MIITAVIIEAIRTGHPLLIIAEITTMIDVADALVGEDGVEELLLRGHMLIVMMDRVPVAVAVGPWVVEGMSENETFTDEMRVHHHHHHFYLSEEVQVHEEKSLLVRKIVVIPCPAEAPRVHHRGLVATLPSRTDRGRVHEIPTLDHPTVEAVLLDQSHGAIPVRHLVNLPNESVVVALAITVMTKSEGRVIEALGPIRLTLLLSRNWQ